jgi:5-formyltetrahydrofolate cyclo-ligase
MSLTDDDAETTKQAIRAEVWELLTRERFAAFPLPIKGRIPNFIGSGRAAHRLAELPEFQNAGVIKVNPDSPQRAVRVLALRAGKTVLVPTPRLREGFLLLDPARLPSTQLARAATIQGAAELGQPVSLDDLPRPDLLVVGTVAVSLDGSRVGKGEGFAELEYATLRAMGRIDEGVPIATTVHDAQVLDYIPTEPWDVPVDILVTPTRVIRTATEIPRPPGIFWEHLSEERLDAMPILRELRRRED